MLETSIVAGKYKIPDALPLQVFPASTLTRSPQTPSPPRMRERILHVHIDADKTRTTPASSISSSKIPSLSRIFHYIHAGIFTNNIQNFSSSFDGWDKLQRKEFLTCSASRRLVLTAVQRRKVWNGIQSWRTTPPPFRYRRDW